MPRKPTKTTVHRPAKYERAPISERFRAAKPDELRSSWETFAGRIAYHCELRQFRIARELVDQAERLAAEADGLIGAALSGGSAAIDLKMPIIEMGLEIRTCNALERINVYRLEELLQCKRERILAIPNVGPKSLATIGKALEKLGFTLPADWK